MDLDQTLTEAGFEYNHAAKAAAEEAATAADMHRGGQYVVLGVYLKDAVSVKVEQNTSEEDVGGLKAQVQHPAVAIVSGSKGTVTCMASDTELVLRMVDELG